MAPIANAALASSAHATGYFYLINTSNMIGGNMDTDNFTGLFEEESYVWPNQGQFNSNATVATLVGSEHACDFNSKELSIDLEMNEGSLNMDINASYQNGLCSVTIHNASPQARSSGNSFADPSTVTVWASNIKQDEGAQPATVLSTCSTQDYLANRGCDGVTMQQQDGGLNVPYTGHLVGTNVNTTIGGYWGVDQTLAADLFVKSTGTWPSQASYGFATTDFGMIADEKACNVKNIGVCINFIMNMGSATVVFDFEWQNGGCQAIYKSATYAAGVSGSPLDSKDTILAVTKPITDTGVPVVNIAACTAEEYNNNTCKNAPKDKVVGGINLPDKN
eukprot:Clim_evm1s57 gene=Clim_evmTU1s57